MEVIDEMKIRVNEDLSECIGVYGAVDEDGNVVSGNQIFVYGEEVDDFVFLKKEAIIPLCKLNTGTRNRSPTSRRKK